MHPATPLCLRACICADNFPRVGTCLSVAQPVAVDRPVLFCEITDVGLQKVVREPRIDTDFAG
jgi:hypothetical protein